MAKPTTHEKAAHQRARGSDRLFRARRHGRHAELFAARERPWLARHSLPDPSFEPGIAPARNHEIRRA